MFIPGDEDLCCCHIRQRSNSEILSLCHRDLYVNLVLQNVTSFARRLWQLQIDTTSKDSNDAISAHPIVENRP
jgi:hypothetical protein